MPTPHTPSLPEPPLSPPYRNRWAGCRRRIINPSWADPGIALRPIRRSCALLGAAWLSAGLPSWAQQVLAPTPTAEALRTLDQTAPGAPGAGIGATAASLAVPAVAGSQMAANKLIDSYELCKIGRLGQHELSFLTVFIMIGCFIFFLQIDRRLIKHGWEIKRALSEPVSLTSTAIDSNQQAMPSTGGHAVEHRVLAPSVSRLIAMAGLIMLILFYFGYGIISLYHFGRTCKMPGDIDGVTKFLYAGLTFFAPYVATRFSEAFTRKERILSVPSRAGASSDNSLATSVRQEGDRSHPPRSLSSADSDHPPAS